MNDKTTSIYIHIPFCQHRCAYCDFNTYSGLEELIPSYVEALCAEIRWIGRQNDPKLRIHTIFFGGGTPSLLTTEQIQSILRELEGAFDWSEATEVTLEANPGTLQPEYLIDIYKLGVNRLSLGMQSAIDQDLRMLERLHDREDVIQGMKWARQAGFDNINLDLIFGLPDQRLDSWKNSLALALSLDPEHLSLYSLTVEHGTPLANWVQRGLVSVADPDLAADMYEYASERLEKQNYSHYEISNWAKIKGNAPDRECRHNLQYWRTLPYLGLGAGAHGDAGGIRTVNTHAPNGYIQRMQSGRSELVFPKTPATVSASVTNLDEEIGVYMMMGLRLLREGISRDIFRQRFGITIEEKFQSVLPKLSAQGLIEWTDHSLRLTPRGYLLGNHVFLEFI